MEPRTLPSTSVADKYHSLGVYNRNCYNVVERKMCQYEAGRVGIVTCEWRMSTYDY